MRYLGVVLTATLLSAGIAAAQTGFSTNTYSNVLPATNDNTQLLTADLNGDGRPDLVSYGSRYKGSTVPGNVFLNNGSGGFAAPVPLSGQGLLAAAAIGDMNGDGYPDIVGCENIGSGQTQQVSVIVYLNQGNGTFKPLPPVNSNGQCGALILGDVYHAGHTDVVTAGFTPGQYGPGGTFYPGNQNTIDIFQNNGTGTLAANGGAGGNFDDPASGSTFTNCGAVGLVGGDFLNNGEFDLIATTTCQPKGQNLPGYVGTTFYLPQSQDSYGNYGYYSSQHLQSAYEIYTHGQTVMDLNGNGRLDALFLGNQNGNAGDLIQVQNNGGESFTLSKIFTSVYFEGAAVADFNSDGYKDIATTYDSGTYGAAAVGPPDLTILAGTPGGTFTDSQDFATGPATDLGGGVVATDFNGDGKPDMATLVYNTNTRTTSLIVYTNTQNGSSTACSAPTTANTSVICSPTAGETLNSPVTVSAASNVTGFTANRLYLDNQSVYLNYSQQVNTPVNAATGPHHLVLVSYNNKGQAFSSSVDFTVGNATNNGCIPSSGGVTICSPVNGQTYNSQITVTAGAMAQAGTLTAMRVYIDNASVYTTSVPTGSKTFQFTENLGVYAGSHRLVVVGYESTGAAVSNSLDFNVPSGPCTASTQGTSLRICSPNATMTLASPITVSAGAYTASGYIAAMRIYIDNAAVALLNNSNKSQSYTISQQVPVGAGKHNLVVVAYPSTGGSISGQEFITVK